MGTLDVKGDLTLGESSNNALTISGDEGNVSCAGGNFTLTHHRLPNSATVEFDGNVVQQTFSGNKITVRLIGRFEHTRFCQYGHNCRRHFRRRRGHRTWRSFRPLGRHSGCRWNSRWIDLHNELRCHWNGSHRDPGQLRLQAPTFFGDITFERYFPAVTDGASWLSVGNYVVGATYSEWTSSFGSAPLMFEWDETHVLVNNSTDNPTGANAWTIVSSGTLEDADFGYLVYTAPNAQRPYRLQAVIIQRIPTALTFFKYRESGGGWHLLTNPYPSPNFGIRFLKR